MYLFLVDLLLPLLGVTLLIMELIGPSDGAVAEDVHPKCKLPPKMKQPDPLMPITPRAASDLCTPLFALIPKQTKNGEFAMLPEFNTENSMAGCNKKKSTKLSLNLKIFVLTFYFVSSLGI